MGKAEAHRMCVDLPGVRLREAGAAEGFESLAMQKDADSAGDCRAWCEGHESCAQSVFASWNKGCYLFMQATVEVREWNDAYNSSLCADKSQKHDLMKLLDKVYKQKPPVPPVTDCSWANDDCSQTKCCNDVTCTWDSKSCKAHSCYQNGATAKCMPTNGWTTGTIIGGGRAVRKVPTAPEGTTLQGTSLYCFMVVDWKSPEGAIANNIKEKKLSVYQCDGHTILTGWKTSKTPWATYMNQDEFVKIWQQVQQQQDYTKYDWTVKVEADTVFFPNMLRMHLGHLKVPQGSRAYVKNINYKFQMLGAIEVFTREAVALYFQKGGVCAGKITPAHPKAGEDFFMKQCMESIGVDGLEDFDLLRDSTCGVDCGAIKGPCSDGWKVAYHAYRDVGAWNGCHGEAVLAQKAQGHLPSDTGALALGSAAASTLPAAGGEETRQVTDLLNSAASVHERVEPDAAAVRELNGTAWKNIGAAQDRIQRGKETVAGARANASDAKALKARALEKLQDATDDARAAKRVAGKQSAIESEGLAEVAMAQAKVDRANAMESHVEQLQRQAAQGEEKEFAEIASQRICMDLPGVRLKEGGAALAPKALAAEVDTRSPEACRAWCREHPACRQSVYSGRNKGCYLFDSATADPKEFTAGYNSTYCGALEEGASMKDMLKKVFKQMPYVPPVRKCAWAGEDCSQSKCCANVPVANWNFKEFQWYTCFKKDAVFSGCHLGPAPGSWDGAILGHMGTREVPKAPEGVLVQGTSLFCFVVVMWTHPAPKPFWSSEAELANNIKETKRSIMQCDDHAFFEGGELGGGDGSSINNIDSFIGVWNHVAADGRYLHHDWIVKVDSDAVFFPDRLRMHINSLRTPQGSRVYLRNINFKFKFMGALEVMTKEALIHFFDNKGDCDGKVGHQGGEDYFMRSCLDGIGVDHQTDFQLLNDKYAATGNCNDPWVVAFHFYKKVGHWNICHDAAVNSAKVNGKGYWVNEK
uniref:Apple domain-containing protein n=1 Tax=Zooxanthella nutricula TaxID=1333877 RepID=A0A7S2LMX0_9DINO